MVKHEFRQDHRLAVLTTMHAKEHVIGPILRDALGLTVKLAEGIDTDQFGAFSREIKRLGSQLDAARAKISAGFERMPSARVGVASEGSFGPHPDVPLIAIGREIVLMIDRDSQSELIGYDTSIETNFEHILTPSLAMVIEFARRVRFPEHGLIVMGCHNELPAPDIFLKKDIVNANQLEAAVQEAVKVCGVAFVETDMRAHRNPTRMAAIKRATRDLIRRFQLLCPDCGHRGFDVTELVAGLPCAWCGEPTRAIMAEALVCQSCGHKEERTVSDAPTADPGQCYSCNP